MGQSFSGAVLNNTNKPLSIVKDVLLPDLRKGQVLVKIAFSGVCHSQLMEIGGHRGEDKFLPHFLGHEASGYVVSIGPLVKKVKIGQPIILSWIKSSGAETGGCDYICESGNKINAGPIATFNEYAVVSENRCVPMPKGIPMDVAALFGCAALTGGGIVKNTLRPKKNSTLAIFGLGGIGVTALMAAKNYDLKRIIVVDINQSKLDAAIKFGADETINASKVNPLKHIRELTNHHGVDYSIDSAGLTKTIEQAFSAVKLNGGISVFASHPKFGNKIKLDPFELISGKKILGSWGGSAKPDHDIPHFCKLYKQGKFPIDQLITKIYKLKDINDAISDLASGKVMRPIIKISA